jgi:Ca2+-binding EF-hand superfamily protein
MVAASLGVDLNAAEVTSMVGDLDMDHDGKINPKEFQLWWLSGRMGCSGTLS